MSRVTVVIPVYKVEDYLKRCVESVLHQTFSDFDVILVDDGSPDHCPEMCDEIAKSDCRVFVIHQPNGGLSAARNSGIEWALQHSESEWITFIDSDDWVHPQFLECNLNLAEKEQLDVCMSQFSIVEGQSAFFDPVSEDDFDVVRTNDAFRREELDPNSACGRLFRKELFRELCFPVGKLHEDRFTTYQVLFQYEKVGVINKPLYFYFSNPEGIVHAEWSPRKLDDLEATEQQLTFFKSSGNSEMYEYTVKDYIHLLIFTLKNVRGKREFKVYERNVRQKLRDVLSKEKQALGLTFRKDFNTYKYAYPFASKLYRRIFMRGKNGYQH